MHDVNPNSGNCLPDDLQCYRTYTSPERVELQDALLLSPLGDSDVVTRPFMYLVLQYFNCCAARRCPSHRQLEVSKSNIKADSSGPTPCVEHEARECSGAGIQANGLGGRFFSWQVMERRMA